MAKKVTTSFMLPVHVKRRIETEARRQGVSQAQIILQSVATYLRDVDTDEHGSWDPIEADGYYDPTRFFTFGEDKKGHSAKVTVLLPKNLVGEISRIVETGDIPEYRSRSHFVRDAVYHRAKQVSQWLRNDELERQADIAMMVSNELQLQQEKEDVGKLMLLVKQNCDDLYQRGDFEFLERYIESREQQAERIPELFRNNYTLILKEYKTLLRRRKRTTAAG